MTTHAYCTYFDLEYIPRGRVLIESLRRNGDDNPIYVLALDSATFDEISSWSDLGVRATTLPELEKSFPQLRFARADRSDLEFVFALTPWLTRWTLDRVAEGFFVTYLDADMAFFSSTAPIYESLKEASVGIVEHRFTWEQAWRRKYGRYNVAWVSFRRDHSGRACVQWWADQCLTWSSEEVDDGRFADQGYLNRFPELFMNVKVIDLPGADVAPWNLRRHTLTIDTSGDLLVDGAPLIFFHFHGLVRSAGRYHFNHFPYLARTTPTLLDHVYRPYCQNLEDAQGLFGVRSFGKLRRRPTLAAWMRFGRPSIFRWLAELRGDYVDIAPR